MATKTKRKTKTVSPIQTDHQRLENDDAAKYLGIEPSTLVNWRAQQKEGQPPYVKVGRAVRYDTRALDRWMESNSRHRVSDE